MPYTGIKIKSKYTDPVGSIDQEDVKGLMEVNKYKLGEAVFCFDKITGRYRGYFGITGVHYFSESELVEMGATPLIESEEMLEEDVMGAILTEVAFEEQLRMLATYVSKANKAINVLKGVK